MSIFFSITIVLVAHIITAEQEDQFAGKNNHENTISRTKFEFVNFRLKKYLFFVFLFLNRLGGQIKTTKYVGCVLPYQYVNPNYHEQTARTCANLLENINKNSLRRPNPQEQRIECDCMPGFAMNHRGFCIKETRCNKMEAYGTIASDAKKDHFYFEKTKHNYQNGNDIHKLSEPFDLNKDGHNRIDKRNDDEDDEDDEDDDDDENDTDEDCCCYCSDGCSDDECNECCNCNSDCSEDDDDESSSGSDDCNCAENQSIINSPTVGITNSEAPIDNNNNTRLNVVGNNQNSTKPSQLSPRIVQAFQKYM